jgi:hypothetical protein
MPRCDDDQQRTEQARPQPAEQQHAAGGNRHRAHQALPDRWTNRATEYHRAQSGAERPRGEHQAGGDRNCQRVVEARRVRGGKAHLDTSNATSQPNSMRVRNVRSSKTRRTPANITANRDVPRAAGPAAADRWRTPSEINNAEAPNAPASATSAARTPRKATTSPPSAWPETMPAWSVVWVTRCARWKPSSENVGIPSMSQHPSSQHPWLFRLPFGTIC